MAKSLKTQLFDLIETLPGKTVTRRQLATLYFCKIRRPAAYSEFSDTELAELNFDIDPKQFTDRVSRCHRKLEKITTTKPFTFKLVTVK